MAQFADLKGLNHFRQKVKEAERKYKLLQSVLETICQQGARYAKNLYGGAESINVSFEIGADKKSGKIIAEGEQVAYLEFGTGEQGRGTYDGNLPEKPIQFFSERLNENVSLDGWVYSYAHEIDEEQEPWIGFKAKAQMWKTAQYLRENIPRIISEVAQK